MYGSRKSASPGLPPRRAPDWTEARRMHGAGAADAVIAVALGVPEASVQAWRELLGLEPGPEAWQP